MACVSITKWSVIVEGASLVALLVKNMPAVREIWGQFLDQEHPLKNEMATYASILAWRIP